MKQNYVGAYCIRPQSGRGITLIALVVTIIVLIILAAVSLNVLLGQNGIISRASQAAQQTRIASAKEQIEMDILEAQIDTYGKTTLEELKDKGIIDDIVDGVGVVTEDGYVFTVEEKEDGSFEVNLVGKEGETTILGTHSINPETTTSKVEITVKGTYLGQGIKEIERPDGSKELGGASIKIVGTTYEVTANGEYTFKIIGNDNKELDYKVTISNIDISFPSGSHTLNPEGGTWGTSVAITVTGTDEQGIASIEKPDGSIVTTNPVTYTVTANGDYTFRIKDTNNNITEYIVTVANIDREGPNVTYTLNPNPPATGASVTITLNATDSKSGVKSITKPDSTAVTANSTTYTVTENGTYTFTVKDNLDNQTTQNITINNIDITPLTGAASYNPSTITAGPVLVTITTSKLINTPLGWTKVDDKHYTKSYSDNATENITIQDLAGNTENVNVAVNNIVSDLSMANLVEAGAINIGDYVAYTPTTGTFSWNTTENGITYETYSGAISYNSTLTTESLNWRVLDVVGSQVRLISELSTTNRAVFTGYQGYNNGVYLLNKICNTLYSGSKGTAKSLKIEDIQDKMNLSVWNYTSYEEYGNTYNPSQRYYPEIFKSEKNQIVNGVAGTTYGVSEQTSLINQTSAQQVSSWTVKFTYWSNYLDSVNFTNSKYYDIFFKNSEESNSWLASRSIRTGPTWCEFYLMRTSRSNEVTGSPVYRAYNGDIGNYHGTIRPVVTLNSGVTLNAGDGTKDGTSAAKAWELQ